jgi:TPR repeat protein
MGIGTPVNANLAFEWFLKAANRNHAAAQYQAGMRLLDGVGLPRNFDAALEVLRRSANQNYGPAIQALRNIAYEINAARHAGLIQQGLRNFG